jgi:hypothetical protein
LKGGTAEFSSERFFWRTDGIDSLVRYPGKTEWLAQRQGAEEGGPEAAVFILEVAFASSRNDIGAQLSSLD